MITNHRLPEATFSALAAGGGSLTAIRYLGEVQQSKHLMLLHAAAEAAEGSDPAAPGTAAFWAGYRLLTQVKAADPGAGAWLLALPNLGGWLHDCLIRLDQGLEPDLAHGACVAAAAAARAGLPFDLMVPVRDGRVQLPGLGSLRVDGRPPWIRLRGDAERVTAGESLEVPRRALAPDDGTAGSVPHWHATPMVRAVADGLVWDVRLETGDLYLDRYTLPMSAGLPAGEVDRWRRRVQSAWEVLVRHHRTAAEPITAGISVIVPLTAEHDTDLISATTPAAFGAIATSWPPDAVTLAETLVHEFQHVKLCGLMDMVPLAAAGGDKIYAPWRQDPRPAAGLLQGVYAHLGIARFWQAQQHAGTDPDEVLRAQVLFARWRPAIGQVARTLLETDRLTEAGMRFAGILRDQGQRLESEPVPAGAREVAAEAALDHRLTWEMRHMAFEPGDVARLAAAYQRGEPFPGHVRPEARIEEDTRKTGSTVRSRLLEMRYLAPARYRELRAADVPGLTGADVLLLDRRASAAVQAYRDLITDSAAPQPDAWIGLALALHQAPRSALRQTFADHLALMFDIHACLDDRRDPLDLAGWLT